MTIKIDELQKIIILLLSKLKDSKGNEVEIDSDFYWDISMNEIYNPYQDPKNITLGQLSSDLEEIYRLVEKKEDAIPYDLKRIAAIIKAISIENQTSF